MLDLISSIIDFNRDGNDNGHFLPPSAVKVFSEKDLVDFNAVFPDLVRELSSEQEQYADMPTANKHLSKCLQYNATKGKRNRGMTVHKTYKLLKGDDPDSKRKANILGWCVELFQASRVVAADIVHGVEERRGQPTWKAQHGATAVNDCFMMESAVYALLRRHFGDAPFYLRLVDEFHETTRHAAMGQALDLITSNMRDAKGRVDLDAFTMNRFASIVRYKNSYHSFCLPVSLGLILAGFEHEGVHRQAKSILLEMGHFFRIQDDFADCFGDPKTLDSGRVGLSVEHAKCSWLIAVAMQRASKEQKEILKDCYGSPDRDKVERVIGIYKELKLPKVFRTYREESYNDIILHMKQIQGGGEILPPKLFTTFLDRIYG